MKKMMVVACAMVAAVAAFADDALPPLRLAGFAICDKVDEAVCKARGFSAPEKVVVYTNGKTLYCCKRAAPMEGYDEAGLVLSLEGKIICIMGFLHVSGEAEYERKWQELTAKYKAEFAAYECEEGKGTKEFWIEYDNNRVRVMFTNIATKYAAARAYYIFSHR